jgi:hypothetical protein
VESNCTRELREGCHLGSEQDDKEATITLTTWVNEIQQDMETKGMETLFYMFTPADQKEIYMLTDWGGVTNAMLQAWLSNLKEGVDKADGTRDTVC